MPEFCGATLDSRRVKPGMLFVAVKGERVDGHDFIPPSTMSQSMNGGTSWRIFVMPPTIAWRPIEQN